MNIYLVMSSQDGWNKECVLEAFKDQNTATNKAIFHNLKYIENCTINDIQPTLSFYVKTIELQ